MTRLTIRSTDRVLLAGKTGSGKTYAARRLLAGVSPLLLVDSKANLSDWPGFTPDWRERLAILIRGSRPGRRRVVPPPGQDGERWYAELFQQAYHGGAITVYLDELALVPARGPAGQWLNSLYQQGRERGIGVWASTQRPVRVPLTAISEAEHIFVFRLNLADDRKRLAEFCGPEVEGPPEDPHGFWYYTPSLDHAIYYSSLQAGGERVKMSQETNEGSD